MAREATVGRRGAEALSDYAFEQLDRDNFRRLAPLMRNAFGREASDDYFLWKFFDNPHGTAIGLMALCPETGVAAGYYGLIPEAYRFGGEVRRVYQATDGMTHSEHRRKGLYRRLCLATYELPELKRDGFLGVGFSGANLVKPYLEMSWQLPFHIPFYFRPRVLSRIAMWTRRSASSHRAIIFSPDISEELVNLVLDSRKTWSNSLELSPELVRWRLSNPRIQYESVIDPGVAYAIAYESSGFVFLLDFHEVEPGAGAAVMHALEARVVARKLKGILTFSQRGAPYERKLRRHGFLRNDFGRGPASYRIPFITIAKGVDAPFVHLPESWAVTPLDHDAY